MPTREVRKLGKMGLVAKKLSLEGARTVTNALGAGGFLCLGVHIARALSRRGQLTHSHWSKRFRPDVDNSP